MHENMCTRLTVAVRFSLNYNICVWWTECFFNNQNVSVYKICLKRKIAEVLVEYTMHNKGILKDTLNGRWFIHSQPLPFTTDFVTSGAAEIKIFPHIIVIKHIVQFMLYLIIPLSYTASTQKIVHLNFCSHWTFNIVSRDTDSQINMWPAEHNLAHHNKDDEACTLCHKQH